MKTLLALLALTFGGCAFTGTIELPLPKGGTATLRSDGKSMNVAIRLPEGYAK